MLQRVRNINLPTHSWLTLRFEAPPLPADDLDFFLPLPPLPPLVWFGGTGGAGRTGEAAPAAATGLGGGSGGGGVEESGSRSEDAECRLASDALLFLAGSGGGDRSCGKKKKRVL